ncbi:MAG: PDZ domain-containing protein [Bacillota bacterium]
MSRLKRNGLGFLGLVMIAAGLSGHLARSYVVIGPGPAEELSAMVSVENGVKNAKGAFLLTAVTSNPANLASSVAALLSPVVDVVPRSREIPKGMDTKKYLRIMESMMRESQVVAGTVALRKLGYHVKVETVVRVEELLQNSPARGLLQEGDVILAVDGKPVKTADEAVRSIGARRAGKPVVLTVKRNERVESYTIRTVVHPEDKARAAVGILVSPSIKYEPPVKINIDSRDIKGSSAGLMFALEILNQLDPRDLTGGEIIAGTGTIGLDGTVGPVAGVKQKVAAAERAGATLFLAPLENEQAARMGARTIRVAGIRDIDGALAALDEVAGRKNGTLGE